MEKNSLRLAQIGILLPLLASFLGGMLSSVLNFASLVMILLAHYYFSKHFKNTKIFNTYIIAYLVMYIPLLIGSFGLMRLAQSEIIPALASLDESIKSITTEDIAVFIRKLQDIMARDEVLAEKVAKVVAGYLSSLLVYLGVIFVGFFLSLIFTRSALVALGKSSKVNEFKTSGLLYLIGALTIIIGVGFIIVFAGYVFQIVGYFNMRELNEQDNFEMMDYE